jgi:Zn-dependent protease with chaperone function
MNIAQFIFLILMSLLFLFQYYTFTPVLRPNSTKSIVVSSLLLFCILLFFSTFPKFILEFFPYRYWKYANNAILCIGLLIGSSWISFINPWLFKKIDAKDSKLEDLSDLLRQLGYKATVVELDENYSAIMSGISYSHPLIGVGKGLSDKLSRKDITAVLLHEMGHARRRHILFLLFFDMILTFIMVKTIMHDQDKQHILLSIFLNSFSVAVKVLVTFKIMYFLEYDADRFAAKIVGKDAYISMLKTLDGVVGGKLTKGDFLHPNLEKRIRNVEKYVS